MAGPGAGGGGQGAAWDTNFTVYMMDILHGGVDASGAYVPGDRTNATLSIIDILNTATAVGGNPYANEAAYSPSMEVAEMDTAAQRLSTKVQSFDHQNSWSTFIATVKARLAEFNLDGDPIADTISSIINTALTDVTDKFALLANAAEYQGDIVSSSAESDAVSVTSRLHAAIKANATAAADAEINSGITAVSNHATNEHRSSEIVGQNAADALTQRGTSAVRVANDTLQDNAVSKGNIDSVSMIEEGVTNAVAHAGTIYDDAEGDSSETLDDQIHSGQIESAALTNEIDAKSLAAADNAASAIITDGKANASDIKSIVQDAVRDSVPVDFAAATLEAQNQISDLVFATVAATQGSLQSIVNSIVSASKGAVDSGIIGDLRDEYESRKLNTHLRSIARYASGMADLNAVQHSTFVVGMGLLEIDFDRDVDDYDKQLSFELFRGGLNVAMNTATSLLTTSFSSYQQLVGTYTQMLSQESSEYTKLIMDIFASRLQTYLGVMPQYFGAYTDVIGKYISGSNNLMSLKAGLAGTFAKAECDLSSGLTAMRSQSDTNLMKMFTDTGVQQTTQRNAMVDSLIKNRSSSFNSMFTADSQVASNAFNASAGTRTQLIQSVSKMFESFVNSQLDVNVRNALTRDSLKQQFVLNSTNRLSDMLFKELDSTVASAQTTIEAQRFKAVLFSEQYVQDLQIDVGDARWDLEAFQYAANAGAAGFGGTVTTPAAMTKTQSVLGGALSGASLGAATGNPLLMGAGALVGGIAGAMTK